MSGERVMRVRTSLARQLARPGGRTFEEAVRLADAGLEEHRAEVDDRVRLLIEELEELCAEQDPEMGSRVYDRGTEILDIVGFFETSPLHQVTLSLCDLADGMLMRDMWEWPPVLVHVQALRLVSADSRRDDPSIAALLDGLRTVTQRITNSLI